MPWPFLVNFWRAVKMLGKWGPTLVIKSDKSVLVTLYVICLFGLGDFQGNHLNQGLKCDKISLFIESIFGLLDVYKDLWPWQSSLIAVAPGNCLRSSSLFWGQFTSSGPVTISVSRWTSTFISCTIKVFNIIAYIHCVTSPLFSIIINLFVTNCWKLSWYHHIANLS